MDKTVQLLKTVLQRQASEYHGEAFAALAKLADQGKHDLADRAMSKATKIYNEKLAAWSCFEQCSAKRSEACNASMLLQPNTRRHNTRTRSARASSTPALCTRSTTGINKVLRVARLVG